MSRSFLAVLASIAAMIGCAQLAQAAPAPAPATRSAAVAAQQLLAQPVAIVTAGFTTPAGTTAYASGDLVANSATAGAVAPLAFQACRVGGGSGKLRRVRVKTADTGFAGVAVALKLYRTAPTVTNGDNGAWLSTEADFIGSVAVTLDQHFSNAEKGTAAPSSEILFDCAAGSRILYGLLVAGGAITPQGAKAAAVTLETLAN